MVTLKQIAKECDVSVSTVSKVIKDYPDISPETKLKVREKATELGYHPNMAARALRLHRSDTVTVLESGEHTITNDYFSRILKSFCNEMEKNGFVVVISEKTAGTGSDEHMTCEGYYASLEYWRSRNIDGIVFAGRSHSDEEIRQYVNAGFPVVTLDFIVEKCAGVAVDHAADMDMLMQYLCDMGHRRVFYLCEESSEKRKAVQLAAVHFGMDVTQIVTGSEPEAFVSRLKELMKEEALCLVCESDMLACRIMQIARDLGFTAGKDYSLTGYGGDGGLTTWPVRLTTIVQDTKHIGKLLADSLIRKILDPSAKADLHTLTMGRLEKGNSVVCL